MTQKALDFTATEVNKKNDTPSRLNLSKKGDSSNTINPSSKSKRLMNIAFPPHINRSKVLTAIDPLGLKLYRENGKNGHTPLDLIIKEREPLKHEANLIISPKKAAQDENKVTMPKNISLNDQELINPYLRVGCTYYKIIIKKDRYGTPRKIYILWKKGEIIQDHGKEYVKSIPHYDEFTILPNNINHKTVIGNSINLYSEFTHKPKGGDWIWTKRLLEQVFGEQYELGLRYMQILYLNPDRSTIILVLVSKERGTGKTTFINWLNMIFGANMVVLSNSDFSSSFNSYCTKNIIAVEETFLEKKAAMEKLKALATAKQVQVNEKFVSPFMTPFFGKIILTSNNEDKFVQVDEEEIRYLVLKPGKPKYINHSIEEELLKEIPAFLHYLQSLPSVDWSVSRSGFTPEELHNEFLQAVVEESRSGLAKDLKIEIIDFFDGNEIEDFHAAAKDIKNEYFSTNNQYSLNYIRNVLKNEFGMKPKEAPVRYNPFNRPGNSKIGRYYEFKREEFVTTLDVTNSET